MRKGNKERKKSLILAGKIKSVKMRGMKMRIITCIGDRKEAGVKNRDFNSLFLSRSLGRG